MYGPATLEFIRRYTADMAFIGAGGLTKEGATDADTRGVWVKRAMLQRSRQSVLLVDRSKFGLHQFETIGPLDRLSRVVCDAAPPPPLRRALAQCGVQLHEAPAGSPRTPFGHRRDADT